MTDKFDENVRKIHRTLIQRTAGDVVGDEALVDVLAKQAVRHANAIENAIDWSKRNRRKQTAPVVSEPSPWTCLADQEPRTQDRCWVAAYDPNDPTPPLGWACRTAKWSAGADGFLDKQGELLGGRFASKNQRNIYWCDEDLFDRPSEVMESILQHLVELADDPPKPEPSPSTPNWTCLGDSSPPPDGTGKPTTYMVVARRVDIPSHECWTAADATWIAGENYWRNYAGIRLDDAFDYSNRDNIYWCKFDECRSTSDAFKSVRQHVASLAKDLRPWIKFGDLENDPEEDQDCWVAVRYSNGNWDIEDAKWQLNGGFMEWVDESRGSHHSHGSLFGPWNYRFFDIYWCDVRHFDDADAALSSISALNP